VDTDGTIVEPNWVLAVLLDYLITSRQWTGGIARSVATTHLLDVVANHHGLTVRETPVGFNYIGELLAKGDVVFGGEESAGLSICGHVPEKDGILACALVAEMVAATGQSILALVNDLFQRMGMVVNQRLNVTATDHMRDRLITVIEEPPASLGGMKVVQVNTVDGCKLVCEDGSWLLLRPSGTEPIVRCYGEATTSERVHHLLQAGQDILGVEQ